MNDLRLTTDSIVARIGITCLNAILHYALYRAVVATIMLVKETILWLFRKVVKRGCATSTDESARSPLSWIHVNFGDSPPNSRSNYWYTMATALENFATITHHDFNWPYPVPLIAKPAQPPMSTGIRLYTPRIDPEDCACDEHGQRSNKNRYKYLAEKERQIYDQLMKVNRKMTNLTSAMLDSNCESMDETMKSVYKTDYSRRGLPISEYRKLMAVVDSPYCSPIPAEVTDIKDGYRDPTRFRYSAIERPHVQPTKTINFLQVPEAFSLWESPFTSRSEYMDTISKMGLSNMKNRQQYLEPLPSTRRRFGDCKL